MCSKALGDDHFNKGTIGIEKQKNEQPVLYVEFDLQLAPSTPLDDASSE